MTATISGRAIGNACSSNEGECRRTCPECCRGFRLCKHLCSFSSKHHPRKLPLRCLQVFAAPTEAISDVHARTSLISQRNYQKTSRHATLHSLCMYRLSRWRVGGRWRRLRLQRDYFFVNVAPFFGCFFVEWSSYVEEEWSSRWQMSEKFGYIYRER